MAKIPFSKLELKTNCDIKTINYITEKNKEVSLEIRQYLPVEEKMDMISKIINKSQDDNGYYNPVRLKIFTTIEMIYAYTNINFTEKQKENVFKLYDLIISSNLFDEIISNIPTKEWEEIQTVITVVIDNIYKYKNSALGVLENVVAEYGSLSLDASEIQQALADPSNLSFLKNILSKMG